VKDSVIAGQKEIDARIRERKDYIAATFSIEVEDHEGAAVEVDSILKQSSSLVDSAAAVQKGNKRILLIDDLADKGWKDAYQLILGNNITIDNLFENITISDSKEAIVQVIQRHFL